MTTDIFRGSLATDGQEADPDDFNTAQRALMARLFDQVLAKVAPNLTDLSLDMPDGNGADLPTGPWAYALSGGAARPIQGSTNAKIKITAGTLFQKLAAADGLTAQLVPYTFPGTDEVTIAAGDATHPRVDIVQMALSYIDDTPTARDFEDAVTRAKTSTTPNIYHRVQCVLSVKQGAPAVSPVYPTPDAGNVAIAGVVVGTNYVAAAPFYVRDTAGASAVLHDQRMPMRARAIEVMPKNYIYLASSWSILNNGANILLSGAFDPLYVLCPIGGGAGRYLGVAQLQRNVSGDTIMLANYLEGDDGAGGVNISATNMNASGMTPATNPFVRRAARFNQAEAGHAPAAGPTITAGGGLGVPLWTSGARCPLNYAQSPSGALAGWSALALAHTVAGASPNIGPTTFWIAE